MRGSYETPVAGTGAGSPSEGYPKLLNALAGTKFKIISGYPGSTQGMLAMERGEVDGAFTSWNTLKRTKQDWLREHVINVLYQCALERHPELRRHPDRRRARRDRRRRDKSSPSIPAAPPSAVRSLAPPGIPRRAREDPAPAFDAMVKDPEFLAEIEQSRQEFQPAAGEAGAEADRGLPPMRRARSSERTEAILRGK